MNEVHLKMLELLDKIIEISREIIEIDAGLPIATSAANALEGAVHVLDHIAHERVKEVIG